jgi:hypothetical protein
MLVGLNGSVCDPSHIPSETGSTKVISCELTTVIFCRQTWKLRGRRYVSVQPLKSFEFRAIFGSHASKLYAISDLGVAGRDNTLGAHLCV